MPPVRLERAVVKIGITHTLRSLLLILAAGLLVACGGATQSRDLSTTRASAAGLYRVSYAPGVEPIRVSRMDSWTVTVQTAAGEPVPDALLGVSGAMPEHNHGLPTQPQMTRALGDGRYLIEGIKFQMPGWWTMTFAIDAAPGPDSVTFDLVLE